MTEKRNVLVMLGWYDHRILMGIARFARQADWHLATRYLYDVTVPRAWKGDGLLATRGSNPEIWEFIRRQSRKQPTVLMGGNNPGLVVGQVREDNVAVGTMAARHFLERGFRNFAYFSPLIGEVDTDRCEGFQKAVRQAGLECKILQSAKTGTDKLADLVRERRSLARQLQALPKPLALFVLDDQVAEEVIQICRDFDLPVPQSVAVLGVGNLELACECSQVPISSVELNFQEIGYRAAEMLERLIAAESFPPSPLMLPPVGVVSRQSTDLEATLHPRLLQAIQFIKDHFQSPIQVGDIAEAAGISPRMLTQLFTRELRQSPAAQLLHVRLERVKMLLRQTDQKIRRIAEVSGLQSERNLRRAFQRKTGILAFRQTHRVVKSET